MPKSLVENRNKKTVTKRKASGEKMIITIIITIEHYKLEINLNRRRQRRNR